MPLSHKQIQKLEKRTHELGEELGDIEQRRKSRLRMHDFMNAINEDERVELTCTEGDIWLNVRISEGNNRSVEKDTMYQSDFMARLHTAFPLMLKALVAECCSDADADYERRLLAVVPLEEEPEEEDRRRPRGLRLPGATDGDEKTEAVGEQAE